MGWFETKTCGQIRREPNYLAYAAHGRMLRAIFPPTNDVPFSFRIGFAGQMYRTESERPILTSVSGDILPFSRRSMIADLDDETDSLEGAAADDAMRAIIGYDRLSVTPSLRSDGKGATFDTGWKEWASTLTWDRHGDWTPVGYYGDHTPGSYPQPYKWANAYGWEEDHGYPWQFPRVHDDWWGDVGPSEICVHPVTGAYYSGYATQSACETDASNYCGGGGCSWILPDYPDNSNGVGACSSCVNDGLNGVVVMGGFPAGCSFIIIEGGGLDAELLALAQFVAPLTWRPGGYVSARYCGRFTASAQCSTDFVQAAAAKIVSGTAMPWAAWKVGLFGDASIADGANVSDLTQIGASQDADDWDITEYSRAELADDDVLPIAELANDLDPWENAGAAAVTVRSVAIYDGTTGDVLLWKVLASPVVLPAGDTLTLTGFVFSIGEVVSG